MSNQNNTDSNNNLEPVLWGAANILRCSVRPERYGSYMLPLLFYKRLSDVYVEEYEKALKKYDDELLASIPELQKLGPELVFLTAGKMGVFYGKRNSPVTHVAAIPNTRIKGSTLGAGDAFLTGVVCGLMQGFTLDKCVTLGMVMSFVSQNTTQSVNPNFEARFVKQLVNKSDVNISRDLERIVNYT